jgi:hypothetical protein
MPTSTAVSEDEERRIDAFVQLTRIERALRCFLEQELEKLEGPRWSRGLPRDIVEKVKDPPTLQFTDFPDLKKILGSKWSRLKSLQQANKAQILTHLEGLEPIRNSIAHSRDISSGESALVQAAYFLLFPLLDDQETAKALPVACHPRTVLMRLKAALEYSGSVDPAEISLLRTRGDYRHVCEALASYERVRNRPGRSVALMKEVRREALKALSEELDPGEHPIVSR